MGKINFALVALLFYPSVAHAYIDPGTGNVLFQVLLSVLFGMMFYLKKIKNWLLSFIKTNKEQ